MSTFISLILCIASTIPVGTARHITAAARAKGFDVSRLNNRETAFAEQAYSPDRCAVTVLPSTDDRSGVYFLYYDRTRAMTPERAHDLITAWEARL